jgi:hypothetical protein
MSLAIERRKLSTCSLDRRTAKESQFYQPTAFPLESLSALLRVGFLSASPRISMRGGAEARARLPIQIASSSR